MKEVKKASFSFDTYKIIKFKYDNPSSEIDTITYAINPSGRFFSKTGIFILEFEFVVKYGENNESELLRLTTQGEFNFGGELNYSDVPDFFFKNSIAIVFPYIRAFVSTLTSLANVKTLTLGLLNFSGLEDIFKENTTVEL